MLFTSLRVQQRGVRWPLPQNGRTCDLQVHVQRTLTNSSRLYSRTPHHSIPCAHPKHDIRQCSLQTSAKFRYRTPNPFSSSISSGYCTHRHHPFAMSSTFTPPVSVDNNQYRLPTNLKPKHYDVTIKTDLEKLTFQGLVKINLDVVAGTSAITLNTSGLDLTKASLTSNALSGEQALEVSTFDKTQERTTFQLSRNLPAGSTAELKIGYSGELTGSMMGYYKSAYEVDGKTKHYALTQFEPTAARRTFPCWDEPLLKATFAITMISREGTVNLSNMQSISEEPLNPGVNTSSDFEEIVASTKNEKWKITKFDTTPPMSSYIVALANGDFEYLESSVEMPLSKKTIPLRIYATKDHIHQAQFALDVKVAVLPLYEKIFDVEYPLPKLDTLVASDFDAGAMENWGLITGRTSVFLLDPERGDLKAKKRVATVQSHEVAHMWFGNITTMEWWNYLYLNEGFATLMGEVIVPDRVWPEWRVNSEFITDHLNRAFSLDAKLSSHPIEVDCPDANHINEIFDALSYSKAASVLRMLSAYIGEDTFLKGVSIYLKKRLFGNSVTTDLWEGISTSSGRNITELMENWITKIGFPVLSVTEDDKGIFVRQDRFLETGAAEDKENETIWNVPLGIVTDKDGKRFVDHSPLLSERATHINLDTSKPFKLNAGTSGVYRVLYTPERLAVIATEAAKEHSIFSLDDKLGLVHDSFALAKAGLAKVSSALTLVDLWKNEKEYLVWSGIGESIAALNSTFWESPETVDDLNALRRTLFSPLVKQLGYDYPAKESPDTRLLRTLAISQAASAKDEGVIAEIQSRFKHFVETGDNSKIPADLQRAIFSTAVKHGGRSEWEAMVKLHDKPKTPQEKIAAIVSLCATQDDGLIKETFEFIEKKARDQDVFYFFAGLAANFKARRALTDYFHQNYDALYKRFEGNFSLHYLVTYSSDYYSSTKDLKKIEDFFKDKDSSKYKLALAQALDGIRARAAFVDRSKEDLKEWLAKRA
ncbi:leucyl aminopeptidase [Crepidotus variabilis]|uniref:Aminopeptidase n=1 Tax=Crepidotus variabilis TaxID=179855 RepID=A0A9P6ER60_9AGAR|nr:leucyl aminopeptidase [Crepidotus variabilis]